MAQQLRHRSSLKQRFDCGLLILVAFACIWQQAAVAQTTEREVQVEWRVLQEQVTSVSDAMPVRPSASYELRNPLLVGAVILTGAALIPKIAQAIVDVYYRYQSGGVVIDIRTQPVTISTSPRVAPGYALVISADGVKTLQIGGAQPITSEDMKDLIDVLSLTVK